MKDSVCEKIKLFKGNHCALKKEGTGEKKKNKKKAYLK